MLPIVAVVLALAASASAAYGPTPVAKCCPAGAGKGICADQVKYTNYDAVCCNDGTWKCQGVGIYVPICDSVGGAGKACAAPPPPPPPPPAKKCCTPRATPKTCSGGYGKSRVPAVCCADGKFRCSGCADFGGESAICKCCAKGDKPKSCTAENAAGYTRQGIPVCCNNGEWKCNVLGSTTKTCAGFLRKGKQCTTPPPPPPPAKCCEESSKLLCTGGYTSNPTCCKDGSWACGSCSSVGGAGKVCTAPPPPPPPATCCNADAKIACTGEYAAPMCCKDGSWTCGTCSSGDGEVCSVIVY